MLFMIVEHFRNQDAVPVYRRFRDHGRMAPEGVKYLSSWVDETIQTCFQLMESPNLDLIQEWISNWIDIVEFEVYSVIPSEEATRRMAPRI